jgi:pyruvate,water dikinase
MGRRRAYTITTKRLTSHIRQAVEKLGDAPVVIVRSSSIYEDTVHRSGAGKYKSVPAWNRTEALLEAINKVVRAAIEIDGGAHATSATPLIVEPLIDAKVAGVAFVKRDVDGYRIIIESTWGLSVTILHGLVSPDRVILYVSKTDHTDITIEDEVIGGKDITVLACNRSWLDGRIFPSDVHDLALGEHAIGAWKVLYGSADEPLVVYKTPDFYRQNIALSKHDITHLADACIRVCGILDMDADIEWAIDGNGIWIVQARQITVDVRGITRKTGASIFESAKNDIEDPWKQQHVKLSLNDIGQAANREIISLTGNPVAPGRCSGVARLWRESWHATDAADRQRLCGILVCDYIIPEMMSQIDDCVGIITSQGGMLSHAAILARELGIPCVTSVVAIFAHVADGVWIEMDGMAGTVVVGGGGQIHVGLGEAPSPVSVEDTEECGGQARHDEATESRSFQFVESIEHWMAVNTYKDPTQDQVACLSVSLCLELKKLGIGGLRRISEGKIGADGRLGIYVPDGLCLEDEKLSKTLSKIMAMRSTSFRYGHIYWVREAGGSNESKGLGAA